MTSLSQFEMALWTLKLLDMQELVDAGAIEDRDYTTWDAFKADPMTWFLMNPAKAPAVWDAMWRHRPRVEVGNVVPLPERRSKAR